MKKKSLKKIAVAALSLALMSPAAVFAGTWEKDGDNWKYKKDDGQYAEYEWVQDTDEPGITAKDGEPWRRIT